MANTDTIQLVVKKIQAFFYGPVQNLFTSENVAQFAISTVAMFSALLIARRIEKRITPYLLQLLSQERHQILVEALLSIIFPVVWLLLQNFTAFIAGKVGLGNEVLNIVSVLIFAWIIIRLSTGFVSSKAWAKLITITAWGYAALSILGLLDPTLLYLDKLSFSLGKLDISLLEIFKGIILLAGLLWLALALSRTVDRQLRKTRTLTPSMQELTSKLTKFTLITMAIIISLTSVGIDLTALAVFSGALGVGIGFGLQKVVANLISGVILLLDRSIKPGDVIELGDTYGWINSLGARFVSVITRDGKEHLIPNEDLITQRVINWSYSDTNVRLKVPVSISFDSDVNKAITLLEEAAMETPRVLESPAPRCLLMNFTENGVNLELRIWASDPNNGVANLKSAVLLKAWNKFKENGISFPYAQRDVHLDIKEETLNLLIQSLQNKKA